jgi:hypothetical protein
MCRVGWNDLPNLFLAVPPRVPGIGLQPVAELSRRLTVRP